MSLRDAHLLDSVGDQVFDDAIEPGRAREFLADSRHHLIAALAEGEVIGFVSAVHYVHPDKCSPELWINELGVAPRFRRQGVATAMLDKLSEIARRLGCSDVWVLTERENEAAMLFYESISGSKAKNAVMFTLPVQGDEAS